MVMLSSPIPLHYLDVDELLLSTFGAKHSSYSHLKSSSEYNDIVARTGGDEFFILLPEMDQHGAAASIERIRNCMQAYNSEYEGPLVSISLGTATADSGADIPLALKKADERMYADKVQRKQQRIA